VRGGKSVAGRGTKLEEERIYAAASPLHCQPSHHTSTMPTQRPFLSNFLAAFRAHSQQPLPKSTPSISSTTAAVASSATIWTSAQPSKPQTQAASETAITSPKPIHAKTNPYSTQSSTAAQDRQLHASLSPLQHAVGPQTHLPRSPPPGSPPVYGPPNKPQPDYPTAQQARSSARRRGSDSSSDSGGFREVRGAAGGEKWFIGGRTAAGEERYCKLSMVKRDRSSDRISADQLSL
jgi:hypothetical protein